MTAIEICNQVKETTKHPESCTVRMALVYMLYNRGYCKQHIAKSLGMNHATIVYDCNRVEELLDVKDEYIMRAYDILKTHILELVPYYDKQNGCYIVNYYCKIDNIKL